MVGALCAATRGMRTLLIEKTDRFGGTTAYSGGGIWIPGNAAILRAGIEDSIELGREYLQSTVGDRVPAGMREAFLQNGPKVIDELEQNPNLEFMWRPFPDYFETAPGGFEQGRSVYAHPMPMAELGERAAQLRAPLLPDRGGSPQPEGMLIGGRALLGRLLKALDEAGVVLRLNCELTRLIASDGAVHGLEVRDSVTGDVSAIRADRGVLLAAGGFERNEQMRRQYQPVGAAWTMGAPGGTGDAIRCGMEIGAAVDLMDESWWSPGFMLPDGDIAFRLYERGRPGAIVVNDNGERYANETLPYDQFGHAMLAGEATGVSHIPSHFICDRRFLDQYVFCSIQPGDPIPAEWFDSGALVEADSLAALGDRLALPAGALERTVTRFNEFARGGVDEDFHRGETAFDRFFGDADHGPNPCLGELSDAPFYAATMVLSDLGTKGGLKCDEHARVLNENGEPIRGLFAAGNTMASVMGESYPGPGCPIGSSMTFAYLGVAAAAE
ncbi:MAG: FAD-dependent oxidoreductase [Actinobacteria bacterium]|nr:FAD-dependent oxidoreductase [Actinomycetota bacterium]